MRARARIALLALAGLASACGSDSPVTPSQPTASPVAVASPQSAPSPLPPASGRSMLFIGNSLTQTNDLPRRVQELARDAGMAVEVAGVLESGFSIGDHIERGLLLPTIRARRWSVVAMQQGPSTLPESRALLIRDAAVVASEVRAIGGQPALLMVWPLPGQRAEDVAASYRAAAEATRSWLLPAGEAWQLARARDPGLVLTQGDGFHPNSLGTYLAALTIHCSLYGALAPASLGSDRERSGFGLSAAQAMVLRESACAAAMNR